jgi:hypothetical protein
MRREEQGSDVLKKAKDLCLGSTFFVPRADFSSPQMRAYMKFFVVSLLIDDIAEETNILGRNKNATFQMVKLGADILLDKYKNLDDLPEIAPVLMPLMKAIFLAATEARDFIPCFRGDLTFVRMMGEAAGATGHFQLEDKEKTGNLSEATFRYLRRYEAATDPFIHLAALVLGEAGLGQDLRENLLFRRALDLASSIAAHVNDLLGLKRDIQEGSGYNLVLFKVSRYGVTLEEGFAQVVDIVRQDTEDFILVSSRLRSIFDKNMKLHKYLRIAEQLVDGHLYWYSKVHRYGELVSINIVEDETRPDPEKKIPYINMESQQITQAISDMKLRN